MIKLFATIVGIVFFMAVVYSIHVAGSDIDDALEKKKEKSKSQEKEQNH